METRYGHFSHEIEKRMLAVVFMECLFQFRTPGFSSKDEFVSCHISSNGKILASAGAGLDQKVNMFT